MFTPIIIVYRLCVRKLYSISCLRGFQPSEVERVFTPIIIAYRLCVFIYIYIYIYIYMCVCVCVCVCVCLSVHAMVNKTLSLQQSAKSQLVKNRFRVNTWFFVQFTKI